MAREISSIYALNKGVVSNLGLARIDVKRLALAAEVQTNFIPRVLGAMMLRPGFQYVGTALGASRILRFIFATDDVAIMEMSDSEMRVWIGDIVLTRPDVATTITNGLFATDLTGWTNDDEAGATSSWQSPNYMQLVGTGATRAIREQHVTCSSVGIEHGIRITIARGPVLCRIGSSSGGDDYVNETTLNTGVHSLSIVPTGDFYIRFFSPLQTVTWVSGCVIEPAGVVAIPTPWTVSDLPYIRIDQSADVVYAACAGYQQRKIERRGLRPNARSWSIALYSPTDGPFKVQNITKTTMTPSAIQGNINLVSSVPYFKATHVGALFSVTSVGQIVSTAAAADNTPSASIRISGINLSRTFTYTITGNNTSSHIYLQISTDNLTWVNTGYINNSGGTPPITTNVGPVSYNDNQDNQILYYRLNMGTRGGTDVVTMTLNYAGGSIRGVARVTGYTNTTTVTAEVLVPLGGTVASTTWQEGVWSDHNGWPTSVKVHEGRMWWSGQNGINGSVSDAYESFDETVVGDAGPINRTIGSGPVDTVNWMLSLKGLVLGAQGAEFSVRASSLDEPLTPTNFNVKSPSTQGSGPIDGLKCDLSGYFIDRSQMKLFELMFDLRTYDYISSDILELAPELGYPGIIRMDIQRRPDTRIHCVRSDGVVIIAVINKLEEVLAWIPVETNGFIEDVVVIPASAGNLDDQVYYLVRRNIGGTDVRYLEKWAQELECRGGNLICKLADSHIVKTGVNSVNVTGLDHLEGQQVVVWADGVDVGTDDSVTPWTQRYTVSGGKIVLPTSVTDVVVGLGYQAQFKSAKLGAQSAEGSPLNQQKRLGHIGIIAAYMHHKGLKFGPSFNALDDMPQIEAGTNVADYTLNYDENLIEFPATWTTDLRICMQAQAPRPVTVLAITPDMERYA